MNQTAANNVDSTVCETGSIDVYELKANCPLPVLLKRMGLGIFKEGKTYCSPLRHEDNPSWGIFRRQGLWFWKDHGNDDHGDEITLLARHFKKDTKADFQELLRIYQGYAEQPADGADQIDVIRAKDVSVAKVKPACPLFDTCYEEQLKMISEKRQIKVESLKFAVSRGVLKFGVWNNHWVYGITDMTGDAIAIRKMDNTSFRSGGGFKERKAHTIKDSRTDWPVGLFEGKGCQMILLVEGVPDFLAAHQVIMDENAKDRVVPVCMLSASVAISAAAMPHFKDKHVRIVAHVDAAGIKASDKWKKQLEVAGASRVDIVDLSAVDVGNGAKIKDLNDFLPYHSQSISKGETKWRVLE